MGNFTIRVYGLLIHEDQILLSRENIQDGIYTKFPGGGLEFGEGIIDCLKREFMEEVEIELSKADLFYITEDYVPSAFHGSKQVISIYYRVKTEEANKIKTGDPTDTVQLGSNGDQILYWWPLEQLKVATMDLPIDKLVVEKLLST